MFEDLATAIHTLDIHLGGAEIAVIAALHHHLGIRLAQAAHHFNESGVWGIDGAISAKGWLTAHSELSDVAASRLLTTGRKLHALPVTTQATLDGQIGAGQLDAILACVGNSHLEKFVAFEATLIPQLAGQDPRRTAITMQHWKNVITSDDTLPEEPAASLHVNNLPDGRYALKERCRRTAGPRSPKPSTPRRPPMSTVSPSGRRPNVVPTRCATSANSSSTTTPLPDRA